MAKLNYQRLSRESMLKNKPNIDERKSMRRIDNDNMPVSLNGPTYVLKFGKYRGKMLKDLPIDYIEWAILNLENSKKDMFIREIQRRDSFYSI